MLLGVSDRDVRHALLVLALIDFERMLCHGERLAHAQHAAMPEDGEKALDELLFPSV